MNHASQNSQIITGPWKTIPGIHQNSYEAMATVFEIYIIHEDTRYAQQAAWQAFEELNRLEQELSRFTENSDISRINKLAPMQSVRIGLAAFECLEICNTLYTDTNGAFDITMGSLVSWWLQEDETLHKPSKNEQHSTLIYSGLDQLELDASQHTVQCLTTDVQIDLGGFGKGYALDKMAELLHDWSIETALIHGGSSSVLALEAPPGTSGWPLTLSNPGNRKQILAHLYLQNRAISGSGLLKGKHIINPHTRKPAEGKRAAWALTHSAATSDALSTAFMVMTPEEVNNYCLQNIDVLGIILPEENKKRAEILKFGDWIDNLLTPGGFSELA